MQRTLAPGDGDDSDARLLEQFISGGDGRAFEALLRRHAAMVHGVCNRILGNAADAEDVFQATFLVLVREGAVGARCRASVAGCTESPIGPPWRHAGPWPDAVRKRHKRRRGPRRRTRPALDELREVLDLELARLPDRYRQVIVLCDLEGQRRKDVAQRLRCPEGTVASRLAKARSLLAARLARHGLTFSAGTLATALAVEAASASVPVAWLPATSQVVLNAVNAGAVSANILTLVQGACRTMLVKKLTAIGAIVLVMALTGIGAGTVYFQTATAGPQVNAKAGNGVAQAKPPDARREVQRLKDEVQVPQKRIGDLEDRLAELQREQAKPLFRGKTASYWLTALKDRDPKFREEALTALGGIAEVDHSLIPTIIASLRDKDFTVRSTASSQLPQLGGDVLPLLVAALKGSEREERNWILCTIGGFRKNAGPAVPAVTALLKSTDPADRIVAAEILGYMGPTAAPAVPALMKLVKDPPTRECSVAARALGQIGPAAREAVPLLVGMLKDKKARWLPADRSASPFFSQPTRMRPASVAAFALGRIGPAAKSALPALRALTVRSPDNSNLDRRQVEEAIQKIE